MAFAGQYGYYRLAADKSKDRRLKRMRELGNILTGIGILIGIFLFLRFGNTTVSIIQSIAKNSVDGIKTLQGRG